MDKLQAKKELKRIEKLNKMCFDGEDWAQYKDYKNYLQKIIEN